MKKAIQRIIAKDMKSCKDLKNIKVEFDENDVMKARAIIFGLSDTRYEFGCLLFNITFPKKYPFVCPKIEYVPMSRIRIHPNIYTCGKLCLSLLGTWSGPGWTSIMDLSSILLSIQSILDENPLRNEPGYEWIKGETNDNYNKLIEYKSIDCLIDTYIKLPEEFKYFKNDIKNYINDNNEKITKKIDDKQNINETIKISIYGINKTIDYKKLKKKYEKLIIS